MFAAILGFVIILVSAGNLIGMLNWLSPFEALGAAILGLAILVAGLYSKR
jgi:hypothetical protein